MTDSIDDLKQQLRQLDALQRGGALSEDAAKSARAALEKRLLDAVMAAPAAGGAAAAVPPPGVAAPPPAPKASRRLIGGLVLFVAAFGLAGTWWLGDRDGWKTAPGAPPPSAPVDAAAGPDAAASTPHSMTVAQIQGMVDTLAARMKNDPNNAEGWLMLGRSYSVLGQFEPAVAAYRHVLTLEPKNAQALADLADALAVTSQGRFDGEPAQLVSQALAADGNNLKALLLAGTIAFDKKDYAAAARHWEKATRAGPPDSELVKQARANLAEARQLAGLPPLTADAAASAAAPAPGATVRGRVELAPALAAKASPDDTVFVFARPAEGSRMPLAILKKRVRDLPLEFTLDDSLAMSSQARLSQASQVVVGARVSKSGQAMPQPGDLEGLSTPVKPGASGLKLVIANVVP
ncbi:c-type cytochrome biogenesis protein CcmI/CycH [Ideonella sp.]|uniref:tetratricopeptide repeat protein n=1 Tax=Ideonella sp. TaxID=1929293 RepID=UPI002B46BA5D|nr:c-type cytochrome biogenesis protein CcmI [Ideonella sp.]HJV68101.1 c-type cytochrome biogenesis protein CcmI [Ideonella sp.]